MWFCIGIRLMTIAFIFSNLANYMTKNDFSVESVGFSVQIILSNTNSDSSVSVSLVLRELV